MKQNWQTTITLAVAVAVLLGIIYIKTGPKTAQQTANLPSAKTTQSIPKATPSTSVPPSSGNLDDIQKQLLQATQQEQNNFSTEAGDASSVSSDSDSINNFGQVYNSNDF